MAGDTHSLARVEPLVLIAVGGFAGAILRHALATGLPAGIYGTVAANALGSFGLGVLLYERHLANYGLGIAGVLAGRAVTRGGHMNPTVLVGIGGTFGALARHVVGKRVETDDADTFAVNDVGSFLLGTIVTSPVGDPVALAFGTGFCGAFTTFSTFAFETVRLHETGRRRHAIANASVHLVGPLLAVGFGSLLVGPIFG